MSDDQDSVTKPEVTVEKPPGKMEKPIAKATGKVPWLMQLNAFCCEASVVGLRYVANQSASVFRRSIWLLLLLAGAAFTTYQIISQIMYYLSYPTNVNVRVDYVPEMRFPSVTICSENIFTLSGATSLGNLPTLCLRRLRFGCKFFGNLRLGGNVRNFRKIFP